MVLTAATAFNHIVDSAAFDFVEAIIIVAVVAVAVVLLTTNSIMAIDFDSAFIVIDTTGFKNHHLILNQSRSN